MNITLPLEFYISGSDSFGSMLLLGVPVLLLFALLLLLLKRRAAAKKMLIAAGICGLIGVGLCSL